jgi:hypothetical protein
VALSIAAAECNAIKLGPFTLGDLLFLSAGAWTLVSGRNRGSVTLPILYKVGIGAAFVSFLATTLFPPSAAYLQSRYNEPNTYALYASIPIHTTNLESFFKFFLTYAIVPLVIIRACRTERSCWVVLDGWILGATLNAIVAVSDSYHVTNISYALLGLQFQGRGSGLTIGPNTLALVIALAVPAVFIWGRVSPLRRSMAIPVMTLMVLASFLSGSRGGTVDTKLRSRLSPIVLFTTIAVVVIPFVLPSVSRKFLNALRFTGNAGAAQSDLERIQVFHQAITDFYHSPIHGVGFIAIESGHDIYIQLLASGGIILFFGWLCMAISGLRALPDICRDVTFRYWAPLAGSIVAWISVGLVENELLDRYLTVPIAMALALLIMIKENKSETFERSGRDGSDPVMD